ncbi:hypothetical protein SLEP1_g7589 [Rubroshorea leprosula]|uniref:Uncharacterized protein n=1 Tax=Rubroshorea leprosula TaxID=152421 RepID=A0AAV5I848_9ROSI|nr:hypothetical protein SLEP1_g7589 [Rubroshorea leprosula]
MEVVVTCSNKEEVVMEMVVVVTCRNTVVEEETRNGTDVVVVLLMVLLVAIDGKVEVEKHRCKAHHLQQHYSVTNTMPKQRAREAKCWPFFTEKQFSVSYNF